MSERTPRGTYFGNPAVHDRVKELHAQGLGHNDIVRAIGCAPATMAKIVKHLGLSFDRTRTQAATKAKQADAAERRANIVRRLYSQAEDILDRLEADEHNLVEVSAGKAVKYTHDKLPPRDIHSLINSIGAAAEKAIRLETVDQRDGSDDAASMLTQLLTSVRTVWQAGEDTSAGHPAPDEPQADQKPRDE